MGDGDEHDFNQKMLYELHTLHEWVYKSIKISPSVSIIAQTYGKNLYEWANSVVYQSFHKHIANPAISYDGEFYAVLKGSSIEIRNKQHSFEAATHTIVNTESNPGVISLDWSQNSLHLLVSNREHDIIIYDVDGNIIKVFDNLGLEIIQTILYLDKAERINALILSSAGKKITHFQYNIANDEIKNTIFELDHATCHMASFSENGSLITTHLDTTDFEIKQWELNNEDDGPLLIPINCEKHQHQISQLQKLLTLSVDIKSRIEKSKEKFLAVLDNSTRMIFVRHLPSLTLAKCISYDMIKQLDAKECIVDIGWWAEEIVALLSAKGKFILVPFKTMDMFEAETFELPSIFIDSPANSVFVLEQSKDTPPHVLDSLWQLTKWTKEPELVPLSVNYKLYRLLQTSPALLFKQKIDNREFGEAILLANRFELDKNEVYKAQWKLNNSHSSAVYDFLYKISDSDWVIAEIRDFVPNTAEFAMMLLDHGLEIAAKFCDDEDCKDDDLKEKWDKTNKYLLNCKTVLIIYNDILFGEPNNLDFDGDLFKTLTTQSIVQTGIYFATRGVWTALDVLMTKVRSHVEEHWLLLLSFLPETLDPATYADILPEFIVPANISCTVNKKKAINEWYKLEDGNSDFGLWDEEPLQDDVTWELSQLLSFRHPKDLEIPNKYGAILGPLSTASIFTWYSSRCNEIIQESCLFDNAYSLLKLGIERGVPLQFYQCTLKLVEDCMYTLNHESVTFDDILDTPFDKLLPFISRNSKPEDHFDLIVDTYLPFVRDVGCSNVNHLVLDHILGISDNSLVPLLQVLEYKSEEFTVLAPENRVTFATRCFKVCTLTENWIPSAHEIIKTISSGELKYKVKYGEEVIKHLGSHSPSVLFHSFEDHKLWSELLHKLCRVSFHNKDTTVINIVSDMIDQDIISFEATFQIIFDECLQVGDLSLLQEIAEYRTRYLSPREWRDILLTHAPLYLESALNIDDAYIDIVRYLIATDEDNILCEIQKRIDILEDMKSLGVLVRPTSLDGDREKLVRSVVGHDPANYLREDQLTVLVKKLDVSVCFLYVIVAEIAYNNHNYIYCKHICTRAIDNGCNAIMEVCVKLLRNKDYVDYQFKETMFYYVIKHVPASQIDEMLDIYHTLPCYIEDRKRKLSDTDLDKDHHTNIKILKIASHSSSLDLDEAISDVEDIQELYYSLLGRSLSATNTNINKAQHLSSVISKALTSPSPDIAAISGRISDILQARILKETYESVNVPRFTYDKVYRKEVIMNLAERSSIELALSLGRKYKVDVWEVHMRHYTWLLLRADNVPDSITRHLFNKPELFIEQAQSNIYPVLDGKKYNLLVTYYVHLKSAGYEGADAHITALNKIRAAIPGLDYKELIQSENPLDILEPLLLDGNVHVLSKMAQHINLTKSDIFRCYCNKLFWTGEGRSLSTYEERWAKVSGLLQHLDSEDRRHFIVSICSSFNDQISYKLRLKISKDNKGLYQHISAFSKDMFEKHKSSYVLQSYLTSYLNPDIVSDVLLSMIFDRDACSDVGELLNVTKSKESLDSLMDKCIGFIKLKIEGGGSGVGKFVEKVPDLYWFHQEKTSDLIDMLIMNMNHVNSEASQQSNDVVNKLKRVCSDASTSLSVLNVVISVLEKHLNADSDGEMITFYKSNSVISEHWGFNIQISDILTNELFTKLCEQTATLAQCRALKNVLDLWNDVDSRVEWVVKLLDTYAKVTVEECELSALLIEVTKQQVTLTLEQTRDCANKFTSPALSHIFILASKFEDLHYDILPDITLENLSNRHLVDLIIEKDMYLMLVNSSLYPVVMEKITRTRPLAFVREVATKLRESGNILESVSVIAQFTTSKYTTFSAYRGIFM